MNTILAAIAIVALIAFAIFFIIHFTKKQHTAKVKDILTELSNDNIDSNVIDMKLFSIERFILDKFHIKYANAKVFVWVIRAIFAALIALSWLIFGFGGIMICACLVIYITMDTKLKNKIEETGVNRIQSTVSFVNSFMPQIASGKSAKQAFLVYVESLPEDDYYRELLEEYLQAEENDDYTYETPITIADITSMYENALYNEEKGVNDYLYIIEEAKNDLFKKSEYYNEYRTRCNEVLKPIELSYYIGVPIIFIALFGTFSSFWFTPWGAVAAILIAVLFFLFKFVINRLNLGTLEKIM